MKLITVHEQEEGQKLLKLLGSYLKEASGGFLHKMLRKKNITLNGKKADGSEKLKAGDEIRLFLSDETYEKFAGKQQTAKEQFPTAKLDILYEDSHVLLVNKPAGMLTQKAAYKDISLNEYVLGYLSKSGQWSPEEKAFQSVSMQPSGSEYQWNRHLRKIHDRSAKNGRAFAGSLPSQVLSVSDPWCHEGRTAAGRMASEG